MSTLILASVNKPVVKTNKISKKASSTFKSPMLTPIERPNDFLAVAERVNGRAAMIGFTSAVVDEIMTCLLYTSPSPRDLSTSRMPSSA